MPSCQQRPADFLIPAAQAREVRVFPYFGERPRLGAAPPADCNQHIPKYLCRSRTENSEFLDVFWRITVFPQGVRILALPTGLIHRLSTLTRVVGGAADVA